MSSVKTILVTGGAGYIGSVTALRFVKKGFFPILFDKLPLKEWNPALKHLTRVRGDLRDKRNVDVAFSRYKPHGVIHLAASTSVSESMTAPSSYYLDNLIGAL